ncbi:hypothetical protein PAPYR_4475 [Paratrimastix pyriformis]|uniref:TRAF-type domain-containing protein n=1 Tax=Paratrimastix pyriformis TaxID=342808 RepID=A0ABQ8UJN7_9EUKA|nr:hypothetical protein PAPYR_4475 [Paratrimastix pyriformis]
MGDVEQRENSEPRLGLHERCHAHYEDPASLSCGDTVCRACASAIGGVCPTCSDKIAPDQLHPSRLALRQVQKMRCHCPNRGLGCEAVVGVLDVEHHLGAECEWREEECDQCHQQVRRAEMAHHKDTTCARKPVACGYADVGCPTSCAQCDLAVHERDGVAAHMGLLRQCLAGTSLELAQTRHELTQTQHELVESKVAQSGTVAALSQTQHDLAQTKAELAQTQQELAAVRAQIDQLFIPPAAPEGLTARWDGATKEVIIDWLPVPSICAGAGPVPMNDLAGPIVAAALPRPPIRFRVQATLIAGGAGCDLNNTVVVYSGPECRCRYRFPPGAPGAVARFAVVAMRGLAESGPSAPATCTRPDVHPAPPL